MKRTFFFLEQSSKIGRVAAAIPNPDREIVMTKNDLDGFEDLRRQMVEANAKEEREFHEREDNSRSFKRNRITCASCKPPNCADLTVCHGAVKCYTSHVRDVDGNVIKSKGCASDFQKAMFYCGTPESRREGRPRKVLPEQPIRVQLLQSNMCNNGTVWPELPDLPVIDDGLDVEIVTPSPSQELPDVIKLVLVIVVPIIILIFLATIILMVMKSCHKRNMEELHKKWGTGWDGTRGTGPLRTNFSDSGPNRLATPPCKNSKTI